MTIRFAAALGGTNPAIARSVCRGAPLGAMNDNHPAPRIRLHAIKQAYEPILEEDEAILAAALMHFARHGLSAAARAQKEAEAAHAAGDKHRSAHWLGICHQLDRRMAAATARRLQA